MNNTNILILSVGRRVELIRALRKTLQHGNVSGTIIGSDISDLAPALYDCDVKLKLPAVGDKKYLKELEKVIDEYSIRAIIPTIDTELSLLAENKKRLEKNHDLTVFISNPKTVEIFQDKKTMFGHLSNHQILTPEVLNINDRDSLKYPVFIKPSRGSSSIHAYQVHSPDELMNLFDLIKEPIIQEYLSGNEYSVDLYVGNDHRIISESHRLRIKTRAGEISIGQVTFVEAIHEAVKRIVKVFDFFGPLTMQFIEYNQKFYLIEINPRLGGGVPMSIAAGIDITKDIIHETTSTDHTIKTSRGMTKKYARFDQMVEVIGND